MKEMYEKFLNAAIPRLSDRHLKAYVGGYEAGSLVHGRRDACAVAHMNAYDGQWQDDSCRHYGYQSYTSTRLWDEFSPKTATPLHAIEVVFEGWGWVGELEEAKASRKYRLKRWFMKRFGIEEEFSTKDRLRHKWEKAVPADVRRHMIYDACVLELAKRASQTTPKKEEAFYARA